MRAFNVWFSVVFVFLLSSFVLTGCGGGGDGIGGAAAPTTAPTAPTGVTATPGDRKAVIAWSAVTGANYYNLYWSETTGVTPVNGTRITAAAAPYTHTGLSNGRTYYYVVTAVNSIGESVASSQFSSKPALPVPTGVTAAPGDGKATIAWTAVPGALSYNIYWSDAAGVTPSNGVQENVLSSPYVRSGLTNGAVYYFVATAVFSNGESAASAQVSTVPAVPPPPAAPTGVAAEPGNSEVTIAWQAVPGATSYDIGWTTDTTNGTKTGATSPYTHTGLVNGTTYYYRVTAVNDHGRSAPSASVSAKPSGAPFTEALVSGKTFAYTDPQGNPSTMTFNANLVVSRSGTTTGTWSINDSGKLVIVSSVIIGNVSTITLTGNTEGVITASEAITNAITPANNTIQTLTLTAVN